MNLHRILLNNELTQKTLIKEILIMAAEQCNVKRHVIKEREFVNLLKKEKHNLEPNHQPTDKSQEQPRVHQAQGRHRHRQWHRPESDRSHPKRSHHPVGREGDS